MTQTYVDHDWVKHDSTGQHKACQRCSMHLDRLGRDVWFSLPGQRAQQATQDNPVPGCGGFPAVPPPPVIPQAQAVDAMPDDSTGTEWAPGDDASNYVTTRNGVRYVLRLVDDGVLPAGWRMWRDDGRRHKWHPVAAEGRPIHTVWASATTCLDSGLVR